MGKHSTDGIHQYLWKTKSYLHDEQTCDTFYTEFDGIIVSFWDMDGRTLVPTWEHDEECNTFYYSGLVQCTDTTDQPPSLMRIHSGGRLQHKGHSLFKGYYDLDLTGPAAFGSDTADLMIQVNSTIRPRESKGPNETICIRNNAAEASNVRMKFHTFPTRVANAYIATVTDDRSTTLRSVQNGTFVPWVVAVSTTNLTIDTEDPSARHATAAANSAAAAAGSVDAAIRNEDVATSRTNAHQIATSRSERYAAVSAHESNTAARLSETYATSAIESVEKISAAMEASRLALVASTLSAGRARASAVMSIWVAKLLALLLSMVVIVVIIYMRRKNCSHSTVFLEPPTSGNSIHI